jgi:choline dehydrogenase-like flavoprotein
MATSISTAPTVNGMSDSPRYDVVVVGAGHNGLTCAAFVAKAGKRVLAVERLWHTGAGAFPMAFTNGWPGRNTAETILRGPSLLSRVRGSDRASALLPSQPPAPVAAPATATAKETIPS